MKTKIFAISIIIIAIVSAIMLSYGGKENTKETADNQNAGTSEVLFSPDSLNLNMNIDSLSVQDLRLLRNFVYARYGYLFMEADLRAYFSANMKSYDSLMWARWDYEEAGESAEEYSIPKVAPIKLSAAETAFVKRVDERLAFLKKNDFIEKNGFRLANTENIVNLFQFKDISPDFLQKLSENNMLITQSANIQLFNIYEENDYRNMPNFITTDVMLQAFHMYFSYTLKYLETKKFIPIIENLTFTLYSEAMKQAAKAEPDDLRRTAAYNATFYAIPYYLISGKKVNIPAEYTKYFEDELQKINAQKNATSPFLEITADYFYYSQFKPRGHYTRSEDLQKYFRAMQWLQLAPYCRSSQQQLTDAVFLAALLNNAKTTDGTPLINLYNAVYEPVEFLVGESDNLSIRDIALFLTKNNITKNDAVSLENIEKVNAFLISLAKNKNKIVNPLEADCVDRINFMPARYLADNEIIQELVDIRANAKRAFPKGLDVFAAFGSKPAMDILINTYKEPENWAEYLPKMKKLQTKFSNFQNWNNSVYSKWIESLLEMQKADKSYPDFMKLPSWDKKNLNTSLASWTDLKHDAILYGEQPIGAECGGGGPPDPICVGYVEPNVRFWTKLNELVSLTDKLLKKNNLMTEDLQRPTDQLKGYAEFLLNVSKKEIKKQKLTDSEYSAIENYGASIEYFTLSVIEPDKYFDSFEQVQGVDKSIAIVADIYTRNILGCNKSGILHEAVGKANNIYVVVEIEGSLYLTKGAIFSYYEFVQPTDTRLTDEEWQEKLENKKGIPPFPVWMNDIILKTKDDPKVDERVFYSSGC
ncbi:hypothetical protein FACS189429_4740 [Bacteroidia bacterium]|nr:hypothetical protein FACS189429_4740 [Bacteroidia bacterium]GHV43798.1 hypothetical protein FACS1894180_3960 [Bacteroidia bacterium]